MTEQKLAAVPWSIVGDSWLQHTTIYDAASRPICRLDLEDWGVDEENQIDLERLQTATAQRIALCINAMAGVPNEMVADIKAVLSGLIDLAYLMNDVSDLGGQLDERYDRAVALLERFK